MLFWRIPGILEYTRYTGIYQVYWSIPGILEYTRYTGVYQVYWSIPGKLEYTRYTGVPGILEYTRYSGIYQVYWVPREEPTEDGLTSSYATILDPLGYNIPGPDTEVHIRYFGEGTPPCQ